MTGNGLHVAEGMTFPPDAITQSFALLAVRRAGKSNAAAVMAEEMHAAGLPWVAIDPKGDWWGLRSSRNGKDDGLPIPIFGGLHGDMPLIPEAGNLIADLIVDQNLTCVLDVSEFPSKAAQMRFLADFAERLFRLHGKRPQPRHLFLEEADDFVPQRVMREQARCVGAWTKMVKQGGSRGLGVTLISQRSAVVNKDALTQTETLIALRTTSPQDRKAISEWVSYHDVARELVDSLPSLEDGEAWACSPHWLGRHGQPAIQRIRFRQRSTFDSGATPTMRTSKAPVASLADIDLGALQESMTAITEKAEQDDPKVLRRRIAELERGRDSKEVATLRAQLAEAQARPPERVEVPVLAPGDVAAIEQVIAAIRDLSPSLEAEAARLEVAVSRAAAPKPPAPAPARRSPAQPAVSEPSDVQAEPTGEPAPFTLGKSHRAFLAVLAQFPEGRTRNQLAMLSGYSVKSSMMDKALSQLRSAGFVEQGQPIKATTAGIDALGGDYDPLPTGPALVEAWMGRLGKAERAFLQALLTVWPGTMTKAQIAEVTGYSGKSSMLDKGLSRLRTLELVKGTGEISADDTLAAEARRNA
jgi:hypothetical protein